MRKNKNLVLLLSMTLLFSCGGKGEKPNSTNTYPTNLENFGFEHGNLDNWTSEGLGAFEEDNISDEMMITNNGETKPSQMEGDYYFSGSFSSLSSFTGTLTSDYFKLGGIGQIALKMGAGKNLDKVYIQFFKLGSDEPLSFTINGETEQLTKLSNFDFNNTTITDQMIRKVVDLSDYLDEVIKIVVTDNDNSSKESEYAYVNLDDFVIISDATKKNQYMTERNNQLIEFAEDDFEEDENSVTLRNGGFETGDLTGWKVVSGNAFSSDNVHLGSEKFWETRSFHQEGDYLLDGFKAAESNIGTIRSEKFTLEDKENGGYVSFKLGGAMNTSCYVGVYDVTKNKEVAHVTNDYFSDPTMSLNMYDVYLDLSQYMSDVMYFTINDNANTGPFGTIVVDDFKINLTKDQVVESYCNNRLETSNVDDNASVTQAYYDLYNDKYSLPVAGEAPVFVTPTECKYSPSSTFNLSNIINELDIRDDYTARNDLFINVESVKLGEKELDITSLNSLDMSEVGNYEVTLKIKDKFDQETTGKFVIEITREFIEQKYDNSIVNGGFETGDLTGWKVISGNVNTSAAVSGETVWWGEKIPFMKEGNFFFNGWTANTVEAEGYSLKSTNFTLGGSGQISFKLGGNAAYVKVYKLDGTLVGYYTNTEFKNDKSFPNIGDGMRLANMVTYVADLSSYVGENLYIEIGDDSTVSDWAIAMFDDIKTYYEEKVIVSEHKDHYDAYNSFEAGDVNWVEAINKI